jgi:hypothetical protein
MRNFSIGFELEYERCSPSTANAALSNFGRVKRDGTVPTGFELESPILASIDFVQKERISRWQVLFEVLNRLNVSTEAPLGCGQHIHVSRVPFTAERIYALNNLLIKFEAFTKAIGGRDFTYYCKAVLNELNKIANPTTCGHDDRYRALNVRTNQETFELRFFKSTTSFHRFMANMQFAIAVSNFTLDGTFRKEDCDVAKSSVLPEFCKFIKGNSKEYVFLHNFLKNQGLLLTKGARPAGQIKSVNYTVKGSELPPYLVTQLQALMPRLRQLSPDFPAIPLLALTTVVRSLNRFQQSGLINLLTGIITKATMRKAVSIEFQF